MKTIPIQQIDAFAERPFEGNPAAVCILEDWLPDATMQAIAEENNLAETAFCVAEGEGYRIRWFTPTREVDLCGHATLAAAFVLFEQGKSGAGDVITFQSHSGLLAVARAGDLLTLDFPARPPKPLSRLPDALIRGLGAMPERVLAGPDIIAVFETKADVLGLDPDFRALAEIDTRGIIATAMGDSVDFVCWFFAPRFGIDEDPVTGSAYCALAPLWSDVFGKNELTAMQLSKRTGHVRCAIAGDRVKISGTAIKYLEGTIAVPE